MQSCLHILTDYIRPPETDKNIPHLSAYQRQVQNSTKFRENVEFPWKLANSVAQLKIPRSTENCGPTYHTSTA